MKFFLKMFFVLCCVSSLLFGVGIEDAGKVELTVVNNSGKIIDKMELLNVQNQRYPCYNLNVGEYFELVCKSLYDVKETSEFEWLLTVPREDGFFYLSFGCDSIEYLGDEKIKVTMKFVHGFETKSGFCKKDHFEVIELTPDQVDIYFAQVVFTGSCASNVELYFTKIVETRDEE